MEGPSPLSSSEEEHPQAHSNTLFASEEEQNPGIGFENLEMDMTAKVVDNSVPAAGSDPVKCQCRSSFNCCQATFLLLGTLAVVISFSMLVGGYQAMFDSILQSQLEISPGSKAYEMWRLTPVPLYLRLYFFNLTNPKLFKMGAKPVVEEVGPYCYREYHEKKNITFHENSTVTFFQERWWIWDEENSGNHTQDDVIVAVNSIPISAAWSVRHILVARESLNELMKNNGEELVITTTASKLMFDGVNDPVLDWIQDNLVPENSTFHDLIPLLPPGITDYDKFGWFYGRNESMYYDGLFNMYTGQDTLDNAGKVDLWNQSKATSFFDAPCNAVSGSAGEMWPPNLKKTFVEFYSSDLCMSMKLYYKEDTEDPNGITGNRYWGNRYTFANGSTVPGHECYCVKGTCAPYGLLNAESCRMGSPAFISFPHFFNADQYLLHQVDGLHPDEDKHAFIMDLIPELGTPMNVAARMQINMFIRPYKDETVAKIGGIDILKNVREVYLPLLWFEELAGMPEDLAGQLKAVTFMMRSNIMNIIFGIMFAIGVVTIAVVIALQRRQSKNKSQATDL